MKKLFVCGGSWSSASTQTPGEHHGELLANYLGYEFTSLARGGISNAGICLQIEYAIEQGADFVLVSSTATDRCEIPYIDSKMPGEKYADQNVDRNVWKYDRKRGLTNIHYNPSVDVSSTNNFLQNPTMISHTFSTLIDPNVSYVTKDQRLSIKMFIADLVDVNWKWQTDAWCLDSCLRRLNDSDIPYIMHIDQMNLQENNFLSWMSNKNYMNADVKRYEKPIDKDPGYHTGPAEQQQMFTEIKQHLEKNFTL